MYVMKEKFQQQKQGNTEDVPETYKFLKTQIKNYEEITLHLNAKSIVNRADDVKEIFQDTNSALLP